MIFVVLALVYVIIVFLDLTANTFAKQPAVATASGWFIAVAVIFGFLMRSGKFSLGQLALIFFPLTFAGLAVGHYFPMVELDKSLWVWLTLGYCFIAAVLPVGLLLQPRDFLRCRFSLRNPGRWACGDVVFRRNNSNACLLRMGVG